MRERKGERETKKTYFKFVCSGWWFSDGGLVVVRVVE